MSQLLRACAGFAFCLVLLCLALLTIVLAPAGFAQGTATATLFKAKCAMCHGADATGNTPMGKKFNIPDLRAPEIQKKSKAELATAITKGKSKMPAFEGKLATDEISQLAFYVRGLKK